MNTASNIVDFADKKPLNKLAWAWSVKTGRATTKLVLIALVECADKNTLLAYPSISYLVERTELNRKTVMLAISELRSSGLIEDTENRTGFSKQIPIYRVLVGNVPTEPTPKTKKVPKTGQSQNRDSTENGTVPNYTGNSPDFSGEQSQKRDTEHLINTLLTPNNIDISNDISNGEVEVKPEAIIKSPKGRKKKESTGAKKIADDVVSLYQTMLPSLPQIVLALNPTRISEVLARTKQLESKNLSWADFFDKVAASDFLMGRKTEFVATLYWLIKRDHFERVLANTYANRTPNRSSQTAAVNRPTLESM